MVSSVVGRADYDGSRGGDVRRWEFTAQPADALDALGEALDAELSPRLYRLLEGTIAETARGLPPTPHDWEVGLADGGARVTLQVEPVADRPLEGVAAALDAAERYRKRKAAGPFVDTRHMRRALI
jgi:hypothetical protein